MLIKYLQKIEPKRLQESSLKRKNPSLKTSQTDRKREKGILNSDKPLQHNNIPC